MAWFKAMITVKLICALVGGIADGITVEVATNEDTNKYTIEETTEHNVGACEGYCEECAKYDADEFYESEEYIEMKKIEEELEEMKQENVEEEEYVKEEEEEKRCSIKRHYDYHIARDGRIYYNKFRPTEHHKKCNATKFYEEDYMY